MTRNEYYTLRRIALTEAIRANWPEQYAAYERYAAERRGYGKRRKAV